MMQLHIGDRVLIDVDRADSLFRCEATVTDTVDAYRDQRIDARDDNGRLVAIGASVKKYGIVPATRHYRKKYGYV